MRILHTADWHLGKRLDRFERLDEQRQVMQEICDIAEAQKADLVLIAGDLFDTFNPPTQATELFYKTLKRLSADGRRAVVAIAGNHDSADRIAAPDPLARECGILLAGYPDSVIPVFELGSGLRILKSEPGFAELALPGVQAPVRILLAPYANEQRLRTFLGLEAPEQNLRDQLAARWKALADTHCDEVGVNLLVAHLFFTPASGEKLEEPEDEKPVLHVGGAQQLYADAIPPQVQYTALGHLHRYIEIRKGERPVVYSSSPLSYSFSEAEQQKYVVMIDAEPGRPVRTARIPLQCGRPLKRLRATGMDEALHVLRENAQALVELSLTTETYLNAAETRQLHDAHEGIVAIIPNVRQQDAAPEEEAGLIDLQRPMEELFADYFRSKNANLDPGEGLMALFREIRSGAAEREGGQ
ncbi:MAG: exonuclease SbcCD subunit D C-terminal domain-containing protein [Candidatus Cyclonatronum sp.]|uniref:metallophosphoesterase family protein n=1 Tax=Cyclonatronum sp. TaxID=3024185 RepID=UPI0025C4B2B1|nr:exonuclease subunit SbcD [Cyclonatronum sp.]MCH8486318.1 exonuclease SbcCD subunit D C-terminal domain-containing protein [Cyclonatronum sp.]